VVVQPGEDGPEGVVVQRLRRRLGASSRADASAALGDRAPAPAPTAARLHGWCTVRCALCISFQPVRDRTGPERTCGQDSRWWFFF